MTTTQSFPAAAGVQRHPLLVFSAVALPVAWLLLSVPVVLGPGLDTWTGRSLLTIGIRNASFNATYDLVEPGYDWIRLGATVLLGLVALGITRRSR